MTVALFAEPPYHAKFRPPSLKNEILTSEAEVEVEAEAEVQTEARYR